MLNEILYFEKCCSNLFVTSHNGEFTASLQAHVLDNITSDTPAFKWSTLKVNWLLYAKSHSRTWSNRVSLTSLPKVIIYYFNYAVQKTNHDSAPNDPIARLTNLGWVWSNIGGAN